MLEGMPPEPGEEFSQGRFVRLKKGALLHVADGEKLRRASLNNTYLVYGLVYKQLSGSWVAYIGPKNVTEDVLKKFNPNYATSSITGAYEFVAPVFISQLEPIEDVVRLRPKPKDQPST